jgi:hypothetical protein
MFPAPPLADSAAHVAWHQLGLGETKVNVALVIRWATQHPVRDRPVPNEGLAGYLAPDSTDRTTCIAAISAPRYWTRELAAGLRGRWSFEDLMRSLKGVLGPCAFYAAYGTPSPTVRSWLTAHSWDLGLSLDPGAIGRGNSLFSLGNARYSWYWEAIYSLSPVTIACAAGRPEGCRAAVLSGASDEPFVPFPDIVRVEPRWYHIPRLVEGQRFLGDVAREIGRERFLSFWTSTQPVDKALAAALKRPVGEWTADWERNFVEPIRLGPAAPAGATVIALGIAALALGLVVVTAARRQLR